MFPAFHLFFGLGITWTRVIIFLSSPYFSFLRLWASWLLLLPYHSILLGIGFTLLSLRVISWACGLSCQPIFLSILCSRLPRPALHIFTTFGLVGQHSCCVSSFHHLILWASLAHLLPLYFFYFHELFAKSFGLPWPNYHIFTSHYYLGLLAFRSNH